MVFVAFSILFLMANVALFVYLLRHLPKPDKSALPRYDRFDALLQLVLNGGRPWKDPPDRDGSDTGQAR